MNASKPVLVVMVLALLVPLSTAVASAQEAGPREVVRIAGPSRFDTAVAVSQATFPGGAERVFVATGEAFPDALAGGAASQGNAPVLLALREGLPSVTAAELTRLSATEVIVLGGEAAISAETAAEVADAAGVQVVRLGGADRYETAVEVADFAFPNGADVVYVATGEAFPDALAGGVAAGLQGGPVLLTATESLPSQTIDALARLAPNRIVVLGESAAVSDAVEQQLDGFAPVERLGGSSRFETAAAVSRATFDEADTVFVATGTTFADALAGTPAAISQEGPLLLVSGPEATFAGVESIPAGTASELERLDPDRIVVLGGELAVDGPTAADLAVIGRGNDEPGGEDPTETDPSETEDPDDGEDQDGDGSSGGGGGTGGDGPGDGGGNPGDGGGNPGDGGGNPGDGGGSTGGDGPGDGGGDPDDSGDTTPPAFPAGSSLTASDVDQDSLQLSWPGATDDTGVTGYQVLVDGESLVAVGSDVRTQAVAGLLPATIYDLSVVALDAAGNVSDPLSTQTTTAAGPDVPGITPPTVDQTTNTTTFAATQFLYTGDDAVQTGVDPQDIEPRRAGALSGRVVDESLGPLPGVVVTVLGHPEFGQTVTRTDGAWDLAVNGGGPLTVTFDAPGYLPVQRQVDVGYQEWTTVEDVVLLRLDPNATAVDLTQLPTDRHATARGSVVTDVAGTRQGTLLVPSGTTASLRFDGSPSQSVDRLTVRVTEYTVGPNGPQQMPAALPPTSEYTYAFEFSADEALAAGADGVDFSAPAIFYAEAFGTDPVMPAGTPIPFGTYDFDIGAWVPELNGTIVRILGIDEDGLARVDTTGDGNADDGVALGMTAAERRTLADLYAAGQYLQRIPVDSFSPKDPNHIPRQPPEDATPPPPTEEGPPPVTPNPPPQGPPDDTDDNGVIEASSQTLRERIDLVGVDSDLVYASDQVPGRRSEVRVRLVGDSVPASLVEARVDFDVAGTRTTRVIDGDDIDANQVETFVWDGIDRFGRALTGSHPLRIRVALRYPIIYEVADGTDPAVFGLYPSPFGPGYLRRIGTNQFATTDLSISQQIEVAAPPQRRDAGLGGWALDTHHRYDPVDGVLTFGDGRTSRAEVVNQTTTLAGRAAGCDDGGNDASFAGVVSIDPGPQCFDSDPDGLQDVATLPDGRIVVADTNDDQVLAIDLDGTVSTFAGTGTECADPDGSCGDGPDATAAQLSAPSDVAVGPDGSVFISERNRGTVRRVLPDGSITTVLGPDADVTGLASVVVTPASAVLIAETATATVRQVQGADAVLVAGDPDAGGDCSPGQTCGDGGVADQATFGEPLDLAVGPNGEIYVADATAARIRRISVDGQVSTVAGGDALATDPAAGEGIPAVGTDLTRLGAVFARADGNLLFAERDIIRRIDGDGLMTTVSGRLAQDCPTEGICGEGAPGPLVDLTAPAGLTVGPDGRTVYSDNELLFGDEFVGTVRAVASPLPDFDGADLVVVDPEGMLAYRFDATGRHLSTFNTFTGADVRTFGYVDIDSNGDDDVLSTVTELTGDDDDDNVTTILRDDDGTPTGVEGPFGQTTSLGSDGNGYLSSITDPGGQEITVGYDDGGLGLLTSIEGDKNGTEYTFAYDLNGRLTSATDPSGADSTFDFTRTTNGYTVEVRSGLNLLTTHNVAYPADGSVVRTRTEPDDTADITVIAPDGSVATTDASGQVTVQRQAPDPRFGQQAAYIAEQTTTTPDDPDTSEDESITSKTLVERTIDGLPDSPTEISTTTTLPDGNTTSTDFDTDSDTETITSGEGGTVTVTYDPQLRTLSQQTAADTPVDFDYDRGRLVQVAQGLDRETDLSYVDGTTETPFLQSVTDPNDETTRYEYDASGRRVSETDPDGNTTEYAYDGNDKQISVRPPGRAPHQTLHDLRDDLERYLPPATIGSAEDPVAYVRDAEGRLTRTDRPDGDDLALSYDASTGQLTTRSTAGDEEGADQSSDLVYNPGGLVASHTGPDGVDLSYAYDGALLATTVDQRLGDGNATTVIQGYNDAYRVDELTVNGASTAFTFDGDGRLTQAGDLDIERDAAGRVDTTTLGDTEGVGTDDDHSPFGELARRQAVTDPDGSRAEVFDQQIIARDFDGRITELVEEVGDGAGMTDLTRYIYTYGLDGRVASVGVDNDNNTTVDETRTYTYDANGNRLTGPDGATGIYDARDRVQTYGPSGSELTYTFDAAGDLTGRSDGLSTVYDASGNLLSAALTNGTTDTGDDTEITYQIDGRDRRVGRIVNSTFDVGYVYRYDLSPLAEVDEVGQVTARFVYGTSAQTPDYVVRDETTYRLVSDHNGSPRLAIDTADGSVDLRIDYDEFGVATVVFGDETIHPFRFQGGLGDSDTGFVRFGLRDYDPALGRFTTRDPILFAGGQPNLYEFAGSDPINRGDPTGTGPTENGPPPTCAGSDRGWNTGGGVQGGASAGPIAVAGSAGVTVDSNGRPALQISLGGGLGAGANLDLGGYAVAAQGTNSTGISFASQTGGGGGAGYAGGVDVFVDSNGNTGTIVSAGTGVGAEVHQLTTINLTIAGPEIEPVPGLQEAALEASYGESGCKL